MKTIWEITLRGWVEISLVIGIYRSFHLGDFSSRISADLVFKDQGQPLIKRKYKIITNSKTYIKQTLKIVMKSLNLQKKRMHLVHLGKLAKIVHDASRLHFKYLQAPTKSLLVLFGFVSTHGSLSVLNLQ